MASDVTDSSDPSWPIAEAWCQQNGAEWIVLDVAGRGGTAPVFTIQGPDRLYALKVYDEAFSSGEKGKIEAIRVQQQVALGRHGRPELVEVYDGGRFSDRLFLLMNRAEGKELEKVLPEVPREKIRTIIDQIARACLFLRSHNLSHRDLKSANVFISDDFSQATLLDLSVTRDIYDPIGIGTDHGNQLPVVATARYSPPEYLFRLEEPSPEYWHGIDIYQLGALLHDLIMKKPMFSDEYEASKENRYRFAWAVATKTPTVQASDVDPDLVYLARRALDKDWKRRRDLKIEDFLASAQAQRANALSLLGLGGQAKPLERSPTDPARLHKVATMMASALVERLRDAGVTASHSVSNTLGGKARRLTFEWSRPDATKSGTVATTLAVDVELVQADGDAAVKLRTSLSTAIEGE